MTGARLDRLRARLERARRNAEAPPDPLSLSLQELQDEISALDENGVNALAAELGIAPEAVRRMGEDI